MFHVALSFCRRRVVLLSVLSLLIVAVLAFLSSTSLSAPLANQHSLSQHSFAQRIKLQHDAHRTYLASLNTPPSYSPNVSRSSSRVRRVRRAPAAADHCHSVLINIGSDTAHQVQRLYSIQQYSNTSTLHVFDEYFGVGSHMHVCTFGFEVDSPAAAASTAASTQLIIAAHRAKQYQIEILKLSSDEQMPRETNNIPSKQRSTSTHSQVLASSLPVVSDLSLWLRGHVYARRHPSLNISHAASTVLLRIQHSLAHLLNSNVWSNIHELCQGVDLVYTETSAHDAVAREDDAVLQSIEVVSSSTPHCKTTVRRLIHDQSDKESTQASHKSPSAWRPFRTFNSSTLPILHASSQLPIVLSPVFMFHPRTLIPYNRTSPAPCASHLLFPSLNSARHFNPSADIYLIINFAPCASDRRVLRQLSVTLVPYTDCLTRDIAHLLSGLRAACDSKWSDFFSLFGIERWLWIQGLMQMKQIRMVLIQEGDNLITNSLDSMMQHMKLYKYHFSHPYVSAHLSSMSFEYIRALNERTIEFLTFTAQARRDQGQMNTCALSGAGQDMRMLYEGAKSLHRELALNISLTPLYSDGSADSPTLGDDVLNSAGVFPCNHGAEPIAFEWHLQVCPSNQQYQLGGPCTTQLLIELVEFNHAKEYTNDLPLLFECADQHRIKVESVQHTAWSMQGVQLNLKDHDFYTSPTNRSYEFSSEPSSDSSPPLTYGTATQHNYVALSKTWLCPTMPGQPNKLLFFACGRAFLKLRSFMHPTVYKGYIMLNNIHFQGEGCKVQMLPVWSALVRSGNERSAFVCESPSGNYSIADVDECLTSGRGSQEWSDGLHFCNTMTNT